MPHIPQVGRIRQAWLKRPECQIVVSIYVLQVLGRRAHCEWVSGENGCDTSLQNYALKIQVSCGTMLQVHNYIMKKTRLNGNKNFHTQTYISRRIRLLYNQAVRNGTIEMTNSPFGDSLQATCRNSQSPDEALHGAADNHNLQCSPAVTLLLQHDKTCCDDQLFAKPIFVIDI